MIYRGEDLPFTLDGITPDIILNPHALPSRMTMAQVLECVKSKYGCYAGLQDGSPFNGDTAENLQEMLHSMGFKGDGCQVMQCGVTGERYKVPIFIGPTFYQVSTCCLLFVSFINTNNFLRFLPKASQTQRRRETTRQGSRSQGLSHTSAKRGKLHNLYWCFCFLF